MTAALVGKDELTLSRSSTDLVNVIEELNDLFGVFIDIKSAVTH